jgi:hypothetical protein
MKSYVLFQKKNNDYYDSFEPLTIEDVEKLKLLKD